MGITSWPYFWDVSCPLRLALVFKGTEGGSMDSGSRKRNSSTPRHFRTSLELNVFAEGNFTFAEEIF